MKFPHGWDQIARFYGWSMFRGDIAEWERRMAVVAAPAGRAFTYDGKPSRGLRVHPAVVVSLEAVLKDVADSGLWSYLSAHSGAFAFRVQRGSDTKLSMHSLGAAIDFDAPANRRGARLSDTKLGSGLGLQVVAIFERHGWTWGGNFQTSDAMHFQAGSGF